MRKKIVTAVLVSALAFGGIIGANQAQAINLGGLLKLGGVTYVVDKFGSEIDSFLNKILRQNNMSTIYSTKVVPIVSVGQGGYVGAAQVTGPTEELDRVEAVAQVEAKFSGAVRVKGLVPVDNVNPLKAERIQGVGVSAIIDIKL